MRYNQNSTKNNKKELPGPTPVNDNSLSSLRTKAGEMSTSPTPGKRLFSFRFLAPAVIAIALVATAVWISVLGYSVLSLIARVF